MYQNNQITQSSRCLMCHSPLNKTISLLQLISPQCLCTSCLNKLDRLDFKGHLNDYPLTIIYRYNDFFKSLLFQYKGLYDLALKDVFLWSLKEELHHRFAHHIVVIAPSDHSSNQKRGFVPNAEIVKCFNQKVFYGLYKKHAYKQSDMAYFNRQGIYDVVAIDDPQQLYHRRVLLFDDVMTSSHTLRACLTLIEQCHPSSIEILVLSTGQKNLDDFI